MDLLFGVVLWVGYLGRSMDLEEFFGCWGGGPVSWGSFGWWVLGGGPVGRGSWGVERCWGSLWVVVLGMLVGSILRTPQPKSRCWTHLLQENNNGVISVDEPIRQCTPDPFPLVNRHPFVIPFWADVHNILSGDIFYHQTTDLALLEDISQHIIQSFPKSPFTPTWALVATWDHVAYYGSTSEKVRPMVHGA